MRDVTASLVRVWRNWTVVLGLIVVLVRLITTWGPLFTLTGVAAATVDAWIGLSCIRAWWSVAEYRWFWWRR
jgi:hypothetical protein